MPSNIPEIRKQWFAHRRGEIRSSARASRPDLHSDRALDHLDVAVAPLLQPFVEIHQPLAQLRILWIAAIDVDEKLLHLG